MVDKVLRRGQAHSRRTQGADTWRTKCGDAAKAESRQTQWRTNGGQTPGTRQEHIAASLLLLRENPMGKNTTKTVPVCHKAC